jgi:mycothiol system anti-sigma-R factor
MNCDEISQLLGAYLDDELEETLQPEVKKHLDECPDCRKEADGIANFSSFVRTTMPIYKAPAKLKAKIRASLRKESGTESDRFFRLRWPLIYAAAILVLGFILTSALRTFTPNKDQELIAQAIANHARSLMVDHLVDVTSSDQHVVRPWFTGKLDYSPPVADLAEEGYTLVGGRIDMLDKRPVAAIVYRHGNQVINVFVWPVETRKIDFDVRSDRGYNFCGWNQAGLNYFCISAGTADEIEKFEDEFRDHANL